MGITLKYDGTKLHLGYHGFSKFRIKVAELENEEFGKIYKEMIRLAVLDKLPQSKYNSYCVRINEMIEKGLISDELAGFCLESDTKGKVDSRQCKFIYETIMGYDDDETYGYSGEAPPVMFNDLKNQILKCALNGKKIKWG